MNNNIAINCKNCHFHYDFGIENQIGKDWCKLDKCIKAQKGDVRQQLKEVDTMGNYEREVK